MRDLLFLSQRIPFPPTKGDKIRSYHFLRHLSTTHRVHLGCFVDDPADWAHVEELRGMVAELCALPLARRAATLRSLSGFLSGSALSLPYFHDRRMARWVRRVIREHAPSTAFIFSSPMAQYLVAGVRPDRVVMDFVDVDSQKWRQYAERRSGLSRWLYRRESRTLLAFERRVAESADASLFVTGPERDLFASLAPESTDRVHAIGNGIDSSYFSPDTAFPDPFTGGPPTLVFTGAMDYWPNIEAVQWFAREVLPHLQVEREVGFCIVGAKPAAGVDALRALPGVTVTGRVADVRPYLAHAAIVVAPILTAQGIQNKVLEGMAMARPVVVSPQAAEGIEAQDAGHFLIARDAGSFAASVARLLADPTAAAAMGRAARQFAVDRFDWLSRFRELDRLIGDEIANGLNII